ncbi:MAG: hypothetical protein AAF581_00530 [Planctomycetota bacterium]
MRPLFLAALLATALLGMSPAQSQTLSMSLGGATITPGGGFQSLVMLTNPDPIAGYTTVVTFDPATFTLDTIDVDGLDITVDLGPIVTDGNGGIEFFTTNINNGVGFGTCAAIFDLSPPFLSQTLAAGGPRSVSRYTFSSLNDPLLVGTSMQIDLENNVGSPPLNNVVTVAGQSVFPALTAATIDFVDVPTFVRGDPNSDSISNIADSIFIVSYLFLQGASPQCLLSADVNADLVLDISDIIYLLFWQFNMGPQPPFPYPACGNDQNPFGVLSCLNYVHCP